MKVSLAIVLSKVNMTFHISMASGVLLKWARTTQPSFSCFVILVKPLTITKCVNSCQSLKIIIAGF